LANFTLTKKQQAVFEFIQRYFEERRISPLIREVQVGCQIASYKSALDRLNALERKGYIRRAQNKHRGIKFSKRSRLHAPVPELSASLHVDTPSLTDGVLP